MGFGDTGGLTDFPDADFNRTLDEAFGGGMPSRTKSGSRRQRARSPTGGGDRSEGSQGSGAGSSERGNAAAGRGLGRQRSNRRASIAAAVSLMANASGTDPRAEAMEEHVTAARAERRIPRRAKTHEDRLQAASMADALGYGGGNDGGDERHNDQRHGRHRHGHHSASRSDLGYDEFEDGSEEVGGGRNDRHRSGRRPRRAASDDYNDLHAEEDRRSRFASKGGVKSFDDGATSMRARRGRRASLVGGPQAAAGSEEDLNLTGIRARRTRRASMVGGDANVPGPAASRGEPINRGVAANRSAGRVRRTSMVGGDVSDLPTPGGSGGYADNQDGLDHSQEDEYDMAEKQEWQNKRANKQKNMLERLRRAKEEEEAAAAAAAEEEEGLGEEADKPEEPVEPEQKPKSRRRASLAIPKSFGMSSTNFSFVDDERKEEKKKEKEEKARRKEEEKKMRKSRMPGRSKSTDGSIPVAAGAATGRARAADRDRRRPGTMLDRIGA